ncbi:voltage-dependent anion channel-domain-containing protein [Clohesyomyces aquaticus]|uniref:Voltage-dependent anion channel-domain-containing protein n=1 Tax=Clohesyomyces aquaticus TaxID=1231657 RepID=A0A1Y1Z477_9PLEO|nr:voltage-dependent anion channel-domain-containing protein [Clohesyomyces aquaticus]
MDPRYIPADLSFESRYHQGFDPRFNGEDSCQSTRANTLVQDGSRYHNERYFPDHEKGYLADTKGKEPYTVNEREFEKTPTVTPRDSIDLEKQEAHKDIKPHDPHQPKLPFGQRLHHFTWAWYTLTMSTGGVSTLISIQPHAFPGLISIGAIFYVLNLIFFTVLCTGMVLRFTKFPGSLKESLKHEREGLFFPTFWLSVATIITSTQKYVVASYDVNHSMRGWLQTSMAIAFWAYVACTFTLAFVQYSFLFIGHTYMLNQMMPSWLLPIFPVMLAGTIASVIAADQPMQARLPILVAGMGCQGLGFTVAVIMYAHYIGRLMQAGLPNREHRGAMFIGVGPPSFTCLAFIGMANSLPVDFDFNGDGLLDGAILRTAALVTALFLWVLAMWFFMIALVAVLHSRPKYFHLGWWAMVFPNTGFVIATISIGNSLQNEALLFAGNGLTIAIVIMWCFVLYHNIRAVLVADIMYPGRDEDVED